MLEPKIGVFLPTESNAFAKSMKKEKLSGLLSSFPQIQFPGDIFDMSEGGVTGAKSMLVVPYVTPEKGVSFSRTSLSIILR